MGWVACNGCVGDGGWEGEMELPLRSDASVLGVHVADVADAIVRGVERGWKN